MARNLSEGLQGDDVKMLQAVLNYHRVVPTDEVLNVDGIFGPRTTKRVRSFQAQNQLSVDGIVGPITSRALMTICQFSAKYTAVRDDGVVPISGGEGFDTLTTWEYELANGVKRTLQPWARPPAKLQYVLEFEAAWVVKNPHWPGGLSLNIGAEIGRTLTTHSPDSPYTYSGVGHVTGKFSKDLTLGPIKLDSSIQAGFEAEHEAHSEHVTPAAQISVASGISFAIVKNRFYLFTQGELGAAIEWNEGTVQGSAQWEGTAGFKLTF